MWSSFEETFPCFLCDLLHMVLKLFTNSHRSRGPWTKFFKAAPSLVDHTGLCPFQLCAIRGHPPHCYCPGPLPGVFSSLFICHLFLPLGRSWNITSSKTYSVPPLLSMGYHPVRPPPLTTTLKERVCALMCILTSYFPGGLGAPGPATCPACFQLLLRGCISPGTYQKLRERFLTKRAS